MLFFRVRYNTNMEYVSTRKIAEQWGISERRVRQLLADGRIDGAEKIGDGWNIPAEAVKPADGRVLRGKSEGFQFLIDEQKLTKIEELAAELAELKPIAHWALKSLREATDLEWTYQSNAIEGNTLTLRETQVVLEGVTVGGKTLKEHLEAINHKHAIDYLGELVGKNDLVTEWHIKNIHQLVLKGIDDENAGRYRRENVVIAGARHCPPEAIKVPELMERLILDNREIWVHENTIIQAALLHGELVRIHPFTDGNGRTARLVMNLVLMNEGLLPIVIRKEDRLEYYEALDRAHVERDYADFVDLLMDLEIEMLEMYLRFLRKNRIEDGRS